MELKQFETQMARLSRAFGEKNFAETTERYKVFYDSLKDRSGNALEFAVNKCIAEGFVPPPLSKIRDMMTDYGDKQSSVSSKYPDPAQDCDKCRDFGWELGETLVTACSCAKGKTTFPAVLAREQANYDLGRKLFPKRNLATMLDALSYPLPYNKQEIVSKSQYMDVGF